MAFESLTDKLQNVFRNLRGKGRLTEDDVREAMKEVKMALLEADVNFKAVKNFTRSVESKAIGSDVMNGLNPAQMVIKIVNDELIELMGSEKTDIPLNSGGITVIMMAGLQGSGKTTTAAKLAGKFKKNGKRPLLVAADVYRPAAIKQLETNAERLDVPFFSMGDRKDPVDIVKAAWNYAERNSLNIMIIDTAGRLQIDDDMMKELKNIKKAVQVDYTVLVVDAMTGQEAVNVAKTFTYKVGIDGVILTKCDGDTRGGAALSVRAMTGKPILYVGMGEKLEDLEPFYPDRMAGRILGMGDVLSLIDKAQETLDQEKAAEMEKKLRKASFGFDDYLTSMEQMRKMGGLESILSMLPGIGSHSSEISGLIDDKMMARTEAMILSMTPQERANPDILNMSRKQRIANGSGCSIQEVNKLVKQFGEARKMMKQMPGMMKGGKGMFGGKKGGFRLPF